MNTKRDIKMIFLGDASVGKSCIIQKYITDEFIQDTTATVGAAFVSKELEIEEQSVVLNIWDTAGQEAYRYLVPMYYRNSDIAIIVFDLTNKDSFLSVEHWIKDVRKNVGNEIMIFVAGNKSDLENDISVSRKDIDEIENNYNVAFFETSALKGDGIEKLFIYSLTHYIQTYPTDFRRNDKPWTDIEEPKSKRCC